MSGSDEMYRLEDAGLVAAVGNRASVRRFLPEAVSRDDITAMVGLAVLRKALKDVADAALEEMAVWPELAAMGAEVKVLRACATFFAAAPVVMAVFALPYVSRGDQMLLATVPAG